MKGHQNWLRRCIHKWVKLPKRSFFSHRMFLEKPCSFDQFLNAALMSTLNSLYYHYHHLPFVIALSELLRYFTSFLMLYHFAADFWQLFLYRNIPLIRPGRIYGQRTTYIPRGGDGKLIIFLFSRFCHNQQPQMVKITLIW